ncbi:hypothetical protein VTJ04DRAFT_10924 [Mycothermus thermophilus]|uniref:uncharacterized protein n=1 Tax=Humicola insolens TaxID=85995 RepID=UPI00374373E2
MPRKVPNNGGETPDKEAQVSSVKAYLDSVFTPREQEILLICLLTIPNFTQTLSKDVDLTKAAERLNFTNPRSVTNALGTIKKKFAEHGASAAVTTPGGGGGSGSDNDNNTASAAAGMIDDNPTPSKRPRTTKAKGSAAAATKDGTAAAAGGAGTPTKKSRAPRTPRGKKGAAAAAAGATTNSPLAQAIAGNEAAATTAITADAAGADMSVIKTEEEPAGGVSLAADAQGGAVPEAAQAEVAGANAAGDI